MAINGGNKWLSKWFFNFRRRKEKCNLNFYKVDSDGTEIFNDREFFEKNFVSAKAKVDALNVEIRAKGILKNIVMDVTKYGITHGKTIENFPPLGIDRNKLFDELESQNSFDENEMNGKTM